MIEYRLNEFQLGTAVRMYLRELHGVPFAAVGEIRLPVYDERGAASAVVQVDPDVKALPTDPGYRGAD